jgi:hypothetical protein
MENINKNQAQEFSRVQGGKNWQRSQKKSAMCDESYSWRSICHPFGHKEANLAIGKLDKEEGQN